MYNILIGGAAGQGIETTVAILQKLLKRSGYHMLIVRDFMSRVRGGHNFSLIRFGMEPVLSHSDELDGIIALNDETVAIHVSKLKKKGFILCDTRLITEDPRALKIDMGAISKEIGNPRVMGSIAVGAILKLFNEDHREVREVLREFIKEQYLEANMQAVSRGYQLVDSRFPHLQGECREDMMVSGSEALSLGAIAAGVRFYCAYPMSPSTTIMEYLALKGNEAGIVVEQAEDEIAAINMAIGASFAGVPAMTGTSGGGFCLMVEALGLSGIAEVPLVVVDVMRPGPATGLPTRTEQSDLKFVISAAQGEFPRMVIALRNHTDAFYQTVRAVHLAEKYQIPVILLSDQYLGDSSATVKPFDPQMVTPVHAGIMTDIHNADERATGTGITSVRDSVVTDTDIKVGDYLRYRFNKEGISPRLIPGRTKNFVTADSDEHDERGWITEDSQMRINMMDKRMGKLNKLLEELQEPEFLGEEVYDTLLIGWGSTYGPIAEAVKILNVKPGEKYAALIFGDIYPLPVKLLRDKAGIAKKIINIEQNATGQLADLIRQETGIVCEESILKYDGRQISGEEIVRRIRREALV